MQKFKRMAKESLLKSLGRIATFPFRFRESKVQRPPNTSHIKWEQYLLDHFDKEGMRILEVGSRSVTGAPYGRRFKNAQYTGFDFYDGDNVDVVGDAHKLSRYFKAGEQFDLIFSSAVFEHLYMPWVVATEIQKLLKVGGDLSPKFHPVGSRVC